MGFSTSDKSPNFSRLPTITVPHNCLTGATSRPKVQSIRISDFVVVKITWNKPYQMSNLYTYYMSTTVLIAERTTIVRFKTTLHNKGISPSVLPSSRLFKRKKKTNNLDSLARTTSLRCQIARKRAQRAPLWLKRDRLHAAVPEAVPEFMQAR